MLTVLKDFDFDVELFKKTKVKSVNTIVEEVGRGLFEIRLFFFEHFSFNDYGNMTVHYDVYEKISTLNGNAVVCSSRKKIDCNDNLTGNIQELFRLSENIDVIYDILSHMSNFANSDDMTKKIIYKKNA